MDYKFGKKNWIGDAFKRFEQTGTKGSFNRWCKRKGFSKVTQSCIDKAKNGNKNIRRKAIFIENVRKTKFGNTDADIYYLKNLI